ncbi:doublecortin domain-containing protein 2B [Pangasianodon hypophthalmus]|uniref:doublecortin domain-containing protein 2B n=1 Tax=Pangasianodon hypophthalmus TaxID=310915 RepID=UPI00147EDFB0|nr:doublecortin domain-containing protein 2B [Pangasianodon hypophthalmus]XP_053088604.1 doublecortin domain-containing protein 2B [Pangasianodon hypophthalmus]
MASSGVTALLPPVKSVVVYKNGDPFFSGRRFIVNQRQVATMESFLNDVTLSIGAPLAVRTLYTPRHGHRIPDLEHLQQGAQYVAAGFERFKKLDYLSLGMKRTPVARTGDAMQAKGLSRPNVSAKWRKVITLPCIIHVFRNGDVLSPAMRFIIPRSLLKNLEQILSLVSEKAMLRTGAVRRLCTLDGVTVTSAEELESGQCYVAVGAERFKKLPYVELLLNKAPGGSADRHYVADRGLHRRSENRKFPQDSNSDSALLHSPERDGRRVKSTGDEAEPEGANLSQPLQRRREGRGEREESSIFYAKPVRVRKHRPPHRAAARNAGNASVFKGVVRRREEVRGAEEVAEDESTAVELPVDQRVAEVVQDEELDESQPETTNHMHQTGAPDEHMTSSAHSSPSPSDREHTVKEYGPSDGETSLPRRSSSPNGETEAQDEDILSEDLEQERGQDDKDGRPQEADEPETQDHTRPPSSSSQQRE